MTQELGINPEQATDLLQTAVYLTRRLLRSELLVAVHSDGHMIMSCSISGKTKVWSDGRICRHNGAGRIRLALRTSLQSRSLSSQINISIYQLVIHY